MAERMTWEQVVLIPLRDGTPTQLKSIYEAIDKTLRNGYIYGNKAHNKTEHRRP